VWAWYTALSISTSPSLVQAVNGLTMSVRQQTGIIVGIDKKESRPLLRIAVVCYIHFRSELQAPIRWFAVARRPPKIPATERGL